MKVIIRTDSSFDIGTGHITRCLTLAQHLREQGVFVSFVCRPLEGNIISLVEEKQFKVTRLSPPSSEVAAVEIYDRWRGVSLNEDIREFSRIASAEKPDWIIVDSYSLSKVWEEKIRNLGFKLFVIDDLYRDHSCDALLDQNTLGGASKYQELTPKNSSLFLGPQFALLPMNFIKGRRTPRDFKLVKKGLIFFGGSDMTGETLKLLKLLTTLDKEIKFDVVIGKVNPAREEISSLCNAYSQFTLHVQTSRMAELMEESDFFIGAGGTTTWERCAMGLPAICITTADNQVGIANELGRLDVHHYLGHWDSLGQKDYISAIETIIADHELRKLYSENSLQLQVGKRLPELLRIFS
jgi:UDP-2,4-diacetamido-2,4,6-trideoxy-beta-L-altropyranose hydrolase